MQKRASVCRGRRLGQDGFGASNFHSAKHLRNTLSIVHLRCAPAFDRRLSGIGSGQQSIVVTAIVSRTGNPRCVGPATAMTHVAQMANLVTLLRPARLSFKLRAAIDLRVTEGLSIVAVMMYIRFPLSLRNVEDLLHKRGIASATRQCASGE